jgi:hypothetical protein
MYYKMTDYKFIRFEVSKVKGKMYNGIIQRKSDKKFIRVPFGDRTMQNYKDSTGLNAYPHLIHGNKDRRERYIARHKGFIKPGYFSPGYFSMKYLW